MTTTLTFQNTPLEMVTHDGVIWISAPELAKALDYKSPDAISRIYRRNQDEFSPDMSLTVNLTVNGINGSTRAKQTRLFSLRGAHLVAMFARSKVAKDFRKWVLNVLDGASASPQYIPIEHKKKFCVDEEELFDLIWLWYAAENMRIAIKKVQRPLYELGVPIASRMHDYKIDYKFYARDVRRVLMRLSENIHYDSTNRHHHAFGEMLRNYSDRL